MRAAKFFKGIWRVNALVILIAGLLAAVLLAFGAVQVGKEIFGRRQVRGVVNTDQAEVAEKLSLAAIQRIHGSSHILVALQSDQDYQQSYFSKSAQAIRNYAFVDFRGTPVWVYPHNRFLFSEATSLPSASYGSEPEPSRAVLFVVRQQDSDLDLRLTYSDAGVVALARPNGEGFTEVLSDVVRVVAHEIEGDALLLLYETSEGAFAASVSLHDFSLLKQGSLPLPTDTSSN